MADLTTAYLGLKLKNPLVASASPLSKKLDRVRRLEESGIAAVVLYSLFEEQITHQQLELDHYLTQGTETYAEALTYFPDLGQYNLGPEAYLEHITRLKQAVRIPIIASLNGISAGGWVEYARRIQEAGADALELNLYYLPTSTDLTGGVLEDDYVGLVRRIRSMLRIPLAVKLSPFFTSIPNIAQRLTQAGANGLVLFNRFYQPDLDLEALEVVPSLELSTSSELRLPLRWVAILYGRVASDLAITGGVHTAQDVLKCAMAGASAVMMASELIEHGTSRVAQILGDLQAWMDQREYLSIAQMKGSMSQRAVREPAAFERANYMKALNAFDNRLP
jgi:dihydroorotate dehydrogenase (fumarate)